MKQTDTVMVAMSMALGVMLVAGLIAIPSIEQQQAVHADNGGVPNSHASSKAQGRVHNAAWCITWKEVDTHRHPPRDPSTRCWPTVEPCSKFESVLTRSSSLWQVLVSCHQVS